MYPEIILFGKEFSTYALMALLGSVVSLSYGAIQVYKARLSMQHYYLMLAYGFVGLIIGAKLFYLVPHLSDIWNYREIIFSSLENTAQYFLSGFVFYGGLIGLFAGVMIYGREFKIQVSQYMKILIPAVPLFHVFGRIGCYLAGCCYGIETESSWLFIFIDAQGIPRIPIQLIEALINLILFFFLIYYLRKRKTSRYSISIYFITYSIIRFVLEFFRDDMERGFFILSTSQWISIILLVIGIWMFKNIDLFWYKVDVLCKLNIKKEH